VTQTALTPTMEDYLEAIFYLQNLAGLVRVRDIARHMEVKMPSVCDALKVLGEKKLVRHEPYAHVELTEEGELVARAMLMRHQQLSHFLRDVLRVAPDTAEADACRIEHVVSPQTMERLLAHIDTIQSCESRHCFLMKKSGKKNAPVLETKTLAEKSRPLPDLKKGQKAQVVRIDPHETLRRRLLDLGFTRGAELEMCGPGNTAAFAVRIKGYVVSVNKKEAALVQVTPR
jgi:DtxR family transcriptional regulator, Mn-dependent transcriptional regulator